MGDFPGGFSAYMFSPIDGVSTATPMLAFRNEGLMTDMGRLLAGSVPGVIGETCKIAIIIFGIYLVVKKVASYEIILGSLAGFTILSLLFKGMNVSSVPDPLYGMLTGGFLFGTVYMATDPIIGAKTPLGKWIYGVLIGIVTVIIRGFALFSGGVMFAILIGNILAPIIDYGINQRKKTLRLKSEVKG